MVLTFKSFLFFPVSPCVKSQIKAAELSSYVKLLHPQECVEQAVELVRRNVLTEMDGRDLARCLAMEASNQTHAYTISMEHGAVYGPRHLTANFNRHSVCREMKKAWSSKIKFRQIILDYFWIPTGSWAMTHWTRSFFTTTLPNFVTENVFDTSSGEGVVFLPFCVHCIAQVVAAQNVLAKYYDISFLHQHELSENALWQATSSISPNAMQLWLGKTINQEEFYCTFGLKDVLNGVMDDAYVRKEDLLEILSGIENFDEVRMIKMKVRTSSSRTVYNEEKKEDDNGPYIRKGPFIGLKEHTVRGIYQVSPIKKTPKMKIIRDDQDEQPLCSPPLSRGKRKPNASKKDYPKALGVKKKKRVERKVKLQPRLSTTATISKPKVEKTCEKNRKMMENCNQKVVTNIGEPSMPLKNQREALDTNNDESATTESTEFTLPSQSESNHPPKKVGKETTSSNCKPKKDSKASKQKCSDEVFYVESPKISTHRPKLWYGFVSNESSPTNETQKQQEVEPETKANIRKRIRSIVKNANLDAPHPRDFLAPKLFKNIQERIPHDMRNTKSSKPDENEDSRFDSTDVVNELAGLLLDFQSSKSYERNHKEKEINENKLKEKRKNRFPEENDKLQSDTNKETFVNDMAPDCYVIGVSSPTEKKNNCKILGDQNKLNESYLRHQNDAESLKTTNKKAINVSDENPDCCIVKVSRYIEERRQPLKKRSKCAHLLGKSENWNSNMIPETGRIQIRAVKQNKCSNSDTRTRMKQVKNNDTIQCAAVNSQKSLSVHVKKRKKALKNGKPVPVKDSSLPALEKLCDCCKLQNITNRSLANRNLSNMSQVPPPVQKINPPIKSLLGPKGICAVSSSKIPTKGKKLPSTKKVNKKCKSKAQKQDFRFSPAASKYKDIIPELRVELSETFARSRIPNSETLPVRLEDSIQQMNTSNENTLLRSLGPGNCAGAFNNIQQEPCNSFGFDSSLNSSISRALFLNSVKDTLFVEQRMNAPQRIGQNFVLKNRMPSSHIDNSLVSIYSPQANSLLNPNTNITSQNLLPRQRISDISNSCFSLNQSTGFIFAKPFNQF